ncbi:MAG: hypothetical protein ACFFC6_13440 [Promethearchaeota archaeon]
MKKFKDIQKTCLYRDNKICTYWPKTTQCHFVACPLFSFVVSSQTKRGIKKRIIDSITFDVNDFDSSTTTLDLIKEVKTNELAHPRQMQQKLRESNLIRTPVERMKCIVCGELITDDKFSTIRDPSGIIIYIHSKGKCQARKDQFLAVREKWLKTHTSEE